MVTYELLKENPNHLDELAQWMFDKWSAYYPGSTFEKTQQWLRKTTRRSDLPITLLAIDGANLVGCAMVQRTELYREKGITPWLGALLVKEQYQHQGVGGHLHKWALTYTKSLGCEKLFLLAFDQTMCDWYQKNGWTIFKTDETRNPPVIVMERILVK